MPVAHLEASYIYACAVLGAFICLALIHQVSSLGRGWASFARLLILRLLWAPSSISRHRFVNPVSRGVLLLAAAFLAAVVAATLVGAQTAPAVATRSGRLGVVNIVPLFLTTQFSFAAAIFGTSIGKVRLGHRFFAWASFLECLVHTILCAPHTSLRDQPGLFGVLGTTSVCLLTFLPAFRRAAFEVFFVSHVSIGVLLAVSLWLHLSPGQFPWRYLVLGAAGMLVLTTSFRLLRIAARNFALSSGAQLLRYTKTRVDPHEGGLVKVTVILAKPLRVRPGDYIYLQIPFLNLNSWLQSHPFTIVSWTSDAAPSSIVASSRATKLTLIVDPQAGWTSILQPTFKRLSNSPDHGMAGIIDGPYGEIRDIGDFGTVFMLATGIGIFAHIPYIRGLLDGISSATVRTRRIRIDWQLDPTSGTYAKNELDAFLKTDSSTNTLDISIYSPEAAEGTTGRFGMRVKVIRRQLDCPTAIDEELKDRRGALLIAVSAERGHRERIRRCIASKSKSNLSLLRDVQLVELAFQPPDLSRRATRIQYQPIS